jgi:hypothetical protein
VLEVEPTPLDAPMGFGFKVGLIDSIEVHHMAYGIEVVGLIDSIDVYGYMVDVY